MTAKVAYTVRDLTYETGLSKDKILAAINGGDLPAYKPIVNGKPGRTFSVLHDDLVAWIRRGQPAGVTT